LPLYSSVDPTYYYPEAHEIVWDLGYLGTYSDDRQAALERYLLEPARQCPQGRFVVAGPMYPEHIRWPENTEHIHHLEPGKHRKFYNRQRFTLNITRRDMVRAGYSPSVRLFEAAACGVPIISDYWRGIETFFEPGKEILIVETTSQVRDDLGQLPEDERLAIGARARARVLAQHTSAHRAQELVQYVRDTLKFHTSRAAFQLFSSLYSEGEGASGDQETSS
jgi:spore maturation protein CgeB